MIEGQEGVSWDEWVALADACERAGLEGLFRSDHYRSVVGRVERESLDAWMTLAGLAVRTTRIRLGTLVSPVTFRHPSVLAKSVATVDHISGGRIELGLGAGWNDAEHAAYGFCLSRPSGADGDARGATRDHPTVVDARHGDVHRSPLPARGVPAMPKPLSGRIRQSSSAARQALARSRSPCASPTSTTPCLRASTTAAIGRLVSSLPVTANGVTPDTLPLSLMATCVVGVDRADVLERTRQVLAAWGVHDKDPARVLAERSERWVVGSADEVVTRLRALEDAGVARVYLQHLAHGDVEMLELIGTAVLPALG